MFQARETDLPPFGLAPTPDHGDASAFSLKIEHQQWGFNMI
jgi:hypothetical protein